jgi:hypothetical protein
MATVLFIDRQDLVKNTIINGNVDTDLFIQFIKIAQQIHIQKYLGTKLYEKIQDDKLNSSLTGDYLELVNDYIKPMLIHYSMVEYLPFAAFQIKSGGIYKHNSETAESANKSEVDYLVEKERDLAEWYTRRFIDYLDFNGTKFPEYTQASNDDIHPYKSTNPTNWLL